MIEVREISDLSQEVFDRVDFIEKACFDEDSAFETKDIPDIVSHSEIRFGLYADELLVGYALARSAFGVGYLYSNAVLPEFRGLGQGRMLLAKRLGVLKEINCLVDGAIVQAHTKPENIASANLLRWAGLRPIQYTPDFYADNKDAILWSGPL